MVLELTDKNFKKEVLESEKTVIVDIYATWCGPCKMMSPVIDSIAEELGEKVKVGKVNSDENRDLVDEIRFVNTKPEGTLYTFDNIDIKMTIYNNTRNANANKEENYNSVISLIEINNHKVLLTSDAYDTKQLNEIASGIGKVEVLKVPHHGLRGCALLDKKYTGDVVGKGSKVKSTALNDLKPDYYVITNSNKKIHNFIKDKKAKYNDLCISVLPKDNLYFVDESARALVFDFTGENIEIESE